MGYIYSYVNKSKNNKTYIGSRCSYKGTPEEDFNIKYFSSSHNKEFLEDLKSGQLEGQILLEVSDPNECVRLENLMIKAYWEQYGKENSYNLQYTIGNNKQWNVFNRKHTDEEKLKMVKNHKDFSGKNHPQYGIKHSPERIKRNSDSHKGVIQSEETRKKISIATKGKNNPMYGKHHSEETRMKISNYNKIKYKWITPSGEIRIMDRCNARRYHPDWVLTD